MANLRKPGLFAIAFLAGMLVTAIIKWPPSQSSDWAAWVQAFGSIGAIGVAIYVSWAQAQNDRARERKREIADNDNILMNVQAIIQNAAQVVGEMPDLASPDGAIKRYFERSFSPVRINCATHALASVDLHRLKWWKAIQLVIEMRECFSVADVSVHGLNSAFVNRHGHIDYRQYLDRITGCKATFAKASEEIGALRNVVRNVDVESD